MTSTGISTEISGLAWIFFCLLSSSSLCSPAPLLRSLPFLPPSLLLSLPSLHHRQNIPQKILSSPNPAHQPRTSCPTPLYPIPSHPPDPLEPQPSGTTTQPAATLPQLEIRSSSPTHDMPFPIPIPSTLTQSSLCSLPWAECHFIICKVHIDSIPISGLYGVPRSLLPPNYPLPDLISSREIGREGRGDVYYTVLYYIISISPASNVIMTE